MKESGYDLFDENDSFYTDICTPYKSENNTDVLLSDRKKDYYNNSRIFCQVNCTYSEYSSESEYLICECNASTEDIDVLEPEKLSIEMIAYSFYESLKNSNFHILKCYKLVFIISLVYFFIYLIFIIIQLKEYLH